MTTSIILSISFLAALYLKLKKADNRKLYQYILSAHLLFFGLMILSIFLLLNAYSFAGYLTDKIWVVLFIATGMLLFGLYRYSSTFKRAYYALFFSVPILVGVGLFIPRLEFITKVAGLGLIYDGEYSRYAIDNIYSIQTSRVGFLSGSPTYSLIEKKFIFFEKVTNDIVPKIGVPKSLRVKKVDTDHFNLKVITAEMSIDTTISF